jgi:serine/threonine protein phosphatase PrpC
MRYSLSGAWLCHLGQVRRMNEDACLAARVVSSGSSAVPSLVAAAAGPWIVAVSDGIGGHRAGAEASAAVVETLAKCERVSSAGIRDELRKLNRRLCERGRLDPEREAMGATVAGIASGARGIFAFNVGDSRVYQMDAGKLVQVTRDDSEAEDLIEMCVPDICMHSRKRSADGSNTRRSKSTATRSMLPRRRGF